MASLWYELGRALRQIILGNAKRAKTPVPTGVPKTKTGALDNAKVGSGEYDDNDSPGRFGPGQTRDISARELASATFEYAPDPDGDPDPGEVIWTWVPYVENDGRGKDRPVLIIGRIDARTVVGCYLSTKYHRDFVSIGTGGWDSQMRESFLSPERLLRITHEGMRRESVRVDRRRFDEAVTHVLKYHRLR